MGGRAAPVPIQKWVFCLTALVRKHPTMSVRTNGPENPKTKNRRSVAHLQGLFAVVVGLALTAAITKLVDETAAPVPIHQGALPYFVVYLITLIPLYHGGLRHLDITYIEAAQQPEALALIFDWGLLFLESCGLFALALFITQAEYFCYIFTGLLCFDAFWAFLAHLFSPGDRRMHPEWRWAIINAVTVVILIIVLWSLKVLSIDTSQTLWVFVGTIAVARTICDYTWCWTCCYSE